MIRAFRFYVVALISCFMLTACGGSGSSSSGGGGGSFAGTYTGIANLTVSGGGASQRIVGSIDFLVRGDGSVVSDPGTDFSGFGTVSGNNLVLNIAASSFNEPGFACLGSFRIEGTISGNTITGTITGSSIRCNGVPISVTGTFRATRVAQSRSALGGHALSGVGDLLRSVVH